jgi:hypothetical protein
MSEIYKRRQRFCFRDSEGVEHKFLSQEDAVAAGGELATEVVSEEVVSEEVVSEEEE